MPEHEPFTRARLTVERRHAVATVEKVARAHAEGYETCRSRSCRYGACNAFLSIFSVPLLPAELTWYLTMTEQVVVSVPAIVDGNARRWHR